MHIDQQKLGVNPLSSDNYMERQLLELTVSENEKLYSLISLKERELEQLTMDRDAANSDNTELRNPNSKRPRSAITN